MGNIIPFLVREGVEEKPYILVRLMKLNIQLDFIFYFINIS